MFEKFSWFIYFFISLTIFSFRIKPERLKFLSLLIKSAFPTESEFTYYVPYANDPILKKKTLAKGKLRDRYTFYRGLLLESDATTRDRKSGKNEKKKTIHVYYVLGSEKTLLRQMMMQMISMIKSIGWKRISIHTKKSNSFGKTRQKKEFCNWFNMTQTQVTLVTLLFCDMFCSVQSWYEWFYIFLPLKALNQLDNL